MPLRPLALSDLLDGAFRLLKVNAALVLGLALAIVGPLQIASVYLQREVLGASGGVWRALVQPTATPAGAGGFSEALPTGAPLVIAALQLLLVVPVLAGAVATVAGRSALGEATAGADVLRHTLRRTPAFVVGALLVHVAEFALVAAGALLLAAGQGGLGGVLIAVGLLTALLVMPLFVVVAPILALERVGPIAALRRSTRLLRPRYGATFGAAVVSALMATFLGLMVAALPTTLSFFLGRHGWVMVGAGQVVATLVTLPFVALVATLIYLDARIRQEGLDLELMMRELLDAR